MNQKDIDFLIEQIFEDTSAGYLVERARWRKEIDKKQPGKDAYGRDNFAYAKNTKGTPIALTKPNMVKRYINTKSVMDQPGDFWDGERTSMWKSIVATGLENALEERQFEPAAVARIISIEANDAAWTATIKPQSVINLCKRYIQSALHAVRDGKTEYKDNQTVKRKWNQRITPNKKDILMLSKIVKSPEFLNEIKKLFGRRLSDPSSWFKTVEKPSTTSRFSDV